MFGGSFHRTFCFLALFIAVLVTGSTSVHAAVLKAGKDNSFPNMPPAWESLPKSIPSDDDILEELWSDKNFEIRHAVNHLSKNFKVFLLKNKVQDKHIRRVFKLLTDSSQNLRLTAQSFIKTNAALLLQNKFISEQKLSDWSKKAYLSDKDLWYFVTLLDILVTNVQYESLINAEYCFQMLEGLANPDQNIALTSRHLLEKSGPTLVEKNIFSMIHAKDFFIKFVDAPDSNKNHFFAVLGTNLGTWIEHAYVTKADFLKTMALLKTGNLELEQNFIDFITEPKNIALLNKLNVLDHEFAQSLIQDIKGEDSEKREIALNLLKFLMRPLALNKSLTASDFRTVWEHITAHPSDFDDPFALISVNIEPLLKSGWFNRSHYEKLFLDFDKKSQTEQKTVLEFLDQEYERFSDIGWISASPLIPVLFNNSGDRKLERLKLSLLANHPDLTEDKHIFGRDELLSFLKNLNSSDHEIYSMSVQIIDNGFDTWSKEELLNAKILGVMLNQEPSHAPTAKFLRVIDHHFDHNLVLFDKANLTKLSEFAFSPLPKVTDVVKDIFSKNYELLKQNRLVKNDWKQNLIKSGLWQDMPQSVKTIDPKSQRD